VISASTFYDLVSGRRQGVGASLLRLGLRAAEIPYSLAVRWRNRRFDARKAEIVRAAVPVISVGNLTVGGTGKTPMVQWLARQLRGHDLRVAIVSRGYGAEKGGSNDEARELQLALPDVPHLQNPDRSAAAAIAVEELQMQCILLDDGFQHRRLARDLDIVLLDATEPFGFEHLLPRGALREGVSSLNRADVSVLSRADQVSEARRQTIRRRAERHAPNALWCEVRHAPQALVNTAGERRPVESVRSASVLAFCGIGNPRAFRATLESCGIEVDVWREFPDHHQYSRQDIELLQSTARQANAAAIVCTMKDLVKIRTERLGAIPLWALAVEIEFLENEDDLVRVICEAVGPTMNELV